MPRLTLQETMDKLLLMVESGHPVVYVVSHEEQRVLDHMAKLVRVIRRKDSQKALLLCTQGEPIRVLSDRPRDDGPVASPGVMQDDGPVNWLTAPAVDQGDTSSKDVIGEQMGVLDALKMIREGNQTGNTPGGRTTLTTLTNGVAVFLDLHPYLVRQGLCVRPLRNTAADLRRYYDEQRASAKGKAFQYKTVVVVAPSAADLDPELDRDVVVLDFPLPEKDELAREVDHLVTQGVLYFDPGAADRQAIRDTLAGAGRGLTLDAFRLALNGFAVRGEPLSEKSIDDMLFLKAKAITTSALEYTPRVDIELGGLKLVKEWVAVRAKPARLKSVRDQYRLPPLKGVVLCGASGGGKSMLAKLIASEFKLALLRLDVGALFASYVGESEERTRRALQMAEILAPVVLWLDEVEKAFSGMGGGDSGVSARVFGAFLTWLSEKTDDVFVVATANDFQSILKNFPEFGRKGRFDEIVFVDLPTKDARRDIFKIYLEPLFKDEYLVLTSADLAAVTRNQQTGGSPAANLSTLDGFCELLAQDFISTLMSGAEIEHAVTESLYEIFKLRQESRGQRDTLAEAHKIVETVRAAQRRAMYLPGTDPDKLLTALRTCAVAKGWLRC